MDLPDSPEGVALFLLLLILSREPDTNQPIGRHILDLFAECWAIINGEVEKRGFH